MAKPPTPKLPPKGPTKYDLVGMPDEDFETMTARLVRLEFPDAFKPKNTSDGGADMVLPRRDEGYERCWQCKHFPGKINWERCKESFETARESWAPAHYTFCFPRELSKREHDTFVKHFRQAQSNVLVDYWNGEELQARLLGSDESQRVARTFFENHAQDKENILRAIEVGGRLDSPVDAMDRLADIGGFLASSDPFFSYPAVTHEADVPPPPPAPGSVMSLLASDGKIVRRMDFVPRDAEALERYGPEFMLQAEESATGEEAAARLAEALGTGDAAQIGEGIDLTFTRLPPAFESLVGQRLSGHKLNVGEATRTRRPVPPWNARFLAVTENGEASIDVRLEQTAEVPDGWDNALVGRYGGLTVTALFRAGGGEERELRWNFHHRLRPGPLREQLAALEFVYTLASEGEVLISDRGPTSRPELRIPATSHEVSPVGQALLGFFQDLRTIADWTHADIELPPSVEPSDAASVAVIAAFIRNQERKVVWHDTTFTVPEDGLGSLEQKPVLRIEQEMKARVLGRVVDLGVTRVQISDYRVGQTDETPDKPGYLEVQLESLTDEGTELIQVLVAPEKPVRPPLPPRRGKSSRKRKKRGGGKKR